jgi:aminoglycoside 6-adenylyltransferase
VIGGEPGRDFDARLVAWAGANELIRASLLTSTRAMPSGSVDLLSDYDVILYVSDIEPFADRDRWLPALGPVLVRMSPIEPRRFDGLAGYSAGVIYQDGTKVDFNVAPVALLRRIVEAAELPAELDNGYRVLLDKDGLAGRLKAPSHRAYIPEKPTEERYLDVVEEFWWETTYVAKYLWRDELVAARSVLDAVLRVELLQPMLEWLIEVEHGWSVRPGRLGRPFKRYLRPEVWAQLEATYAGPGIEENWRALWRTIELFRGAAVTVGAALGYGYPHELDERMMGYVRGIRALPARR